MRPTLRQLEYVVAVAEHASFHRAAEACHVSQPGLSAQIKQLESQLGVQLFERDKRRVLITAAGQETVTRARRLLRDCDELVDAARMFDAPLAGPLRLGVIPTIAPYLLPQILPAVRAAHPELRLRLREDQTDKLLAMLDSGELDLLLLALEADLGEVEALPLFRDHFLLAAPADHPLCARDQIDETLLGGEQVLLLEDGHCLRDQALGVCGRVGAHEMGDFRATSLSTLTQMVAGGEAITLLPQLAVAVECARDASFCLRPFREPQPFRTIGLAWRPSSPRAAGYRELAALMQPKPNSLNYQGSSNT
jgi:LysR family hydrogen peroxide-inducible transcriptional activator